jgi:hypothetical protein
MITSINEFKKYLLKVNESLSKDRSNEFKIKMLVQKCKEFIDASAKKNEFEELKRGKNAEIEAILDEMKATSVIASGVLIEVVKPFQQHRLSSNEYLEFVEKSTGMITEEYKKMHQKAIQLATKDSDGYAYLRQFPNKKNLPTGTLTNEGVKDFFLNIIKNIKNFLASFKIKLNNIKNEAMKFQSMNESISGVNNPIESVQEFDDIYNTTANSYLNNNKKEELINLYNTDHIFNIIKIDKSIGRMESKREYQKQYKQLPISAKSFNEYQDTEYLEQIFVSDYMKQTNENNSTTNNKLTEVLEKAKEVIELAEQETYFEELKKVKQQEIIDMLNEFKMKKIAIDNVLVQIIKVEGKPKFYDKDYQEAMTNAEIVGESISEMANDIFSLYTKVSQVSGSVRQYKDDTNSPDGTLNATFDYVFKKVILPEDNPNYVKQESKINEGLKEIISNLFNKIKRFISSFKISSRRCDNALEQLKTI